MWRVRDRGRNDFYKEQCNFRKGERPKPQELDSLEAATVKGKPENNRRPGLLNLGLPPDHLVPPPGERGSKGLP